MKITVACAFVGRYVRDLADYYDKKERVRSLATSAAAEAVGGNIEVNVNTADGDTAESIYLTVTGRARASGKRNGTVARSHRRTLSGVLAIRRT